MWPASAFGGRICWKRSDCKPELLAHDARLAVLRQQLNPHFLFNSLNSLRALIFEDALKASQMVDRLASLLRYSLQSGSNELVTLSEELIMVNEYLNIERIRFEERLKIEFSISDEATQSHLPRMLLQTLVENAVKHGIERSVSGGTVAVCAARSDGDLRITVSNPGTLQTGSNSTRLGLINAEQRLGLMGPRAKLHIQQVGQTSKQQSWRRNESTDCR
jgi:LytS/YehU family sensor histidine kinase